MTYVSKIKEIRKMRGMTQKELGLAVGFSESTADIRITQYETGTRRPKKKTKEAIAKVLKVEPFALDAPCWSTYYEVMHTLFALENSLGIKVNKINGGYFLEITDYSMNKNISLWYEEQQRLKNQEISQDKYNEWRYQYP